MPLAFGWPRLPGFRPARGIPLPFPAAAVVALSLGLALQDTPVVRLDFLQRLFNRLPVAFQFLLPAFSVTLGVARDLLPGLALHAVGGIFRPQAVIRWRPLFLRLRFPRRPGVGNRIGGRKPFVRSPHPQKSSLSRALPLHIGAGGCRGAGDFVRTRRRPCPRLA